MFEPASLPDHAHNLGFWFVDNNIFFNKTKAIYHATIKNSRDVRYYYHDHVYKKHDWTAEPVETLEEIYIKRAKQLRQKYDYLVLLYSGGSDSSNALKSFINNGVKLDEVTYWYSSHDEDNNVQNFEIMYAGSEILQRLIDMGIEVSRIDDAKYLKNHTLKKYEWILESDPTTIISVTHRPETIYNNPKWLELVNSGKSVGVIIGYEKPRVFFDGENWYSAFMDGLGYNYEKYHLNTTVIKLEPFYTSPDCPQISIKQAHVVKNYIEKNYTVDQYTQWFTHKAEFKKDLYYSIVRNNIYPYWNDSTFTIGKQNSVVYCKKCEWIWSSNTELSQNFFSGLDWVNEKVDPYFLNDANVYNGIKGVWSPWYKLND
jgi:hypothetical protein